jgi:drug/metabolite transporter (DMT)-like permease
MLCGSLLLTLSDAISKLLTDRIGIAQLLFGKYVLVVLVLLALAPLIGVWRIFSREDWKAQLARAALTVISSFLFLLGLRALPLSTCVMLSFVSPLYMTALAPWVLGERVGIHRWAAVSFGFLGVVIISWPAGDGFDPAVLYPLAGALSGALRDLTTRSMTLRSTSESMIFYSVTAMMLAGGVAAKGDVSNVAASDWFLLAVSGITSLIAFYTQVEAFRSAEAATIAPFKYSSLIWVTILDVLLWRHFPTWNVFSGAAIIILAMLYIYHRERAPMVAVKPASPVASPPPSIR